MRNKQELRAQALARRAQYTTTDIAQMSEQVANNLSTIPGIAAARVLMGYLSFGQEISLDGFLGKMLNKGRKICVPRIADSKQGLLAADFLQDFNQIHTGKFGIRVPTLGEECVPAEIDVVLVPGAAFTLEGERLGLGGGYYDRFLQGTGALRVGICPEENLFKDVAAQAHDARMDYIVTPRQIIFCAP